MGTPSTLRILSAGAPKTGVRACAEAFAERTGTDFTLEFATAPAIRERFAQGGAAAEVLVAPAAVMDALRDTGDVRAGGIVELGSITAGVVVRDGAHDPDLSSVEALVGELRAAHALVFNQASSGQHIEKMLAELGLAEETADRTVRTATGAGVMEHLAADPHPRSIGFGQITEIRLHEHLGVHLVGPLPAAVGKVTVYRAAVPAQSREPALAGELVRFMVSAEGRKLLVASGVT